MPKHMNRAQLPEVIATLAELEVHKLSLDDAFIEASRKAIRLLDEGKHTFRLDDGKIVTVTVLPNDEDYVEVELLDVQSLI